ncbi:MULTISPECIES: flagellar protein FlaG [Aeromonas]|uniref:flagellar protein FlaG n=1 Tax=Aeromonas TaxID=642 RepID=UPI000FEB653B|nr:MULTISPECIES: flagellar protein FlaG [Aeromonas]MCO4202470.1 flagellar protein FlaG [Aeromonas taiwanensis]RWT76244.1 flagellin [Aeromonas caviae]
MTTELGNLSSASGASVQLSDKSGQVAAQLLSGAMEETYSGEQQGKQERVQPVQQSNADIEKQVQKLQDFVREQGWTVNFSMEKELEQVVIKVVDADTRTVIRQIPSEELIAINKRIQALVQGEAGANPRVGLLFDSEI